MARISPATFERLSAELAHLTGVVRPEVVDRIRDARAEGDLSENGGYLAAKEEQSRVEGRIIELERLLAAAQVASGPVEVASAQSGVVVEVEFLSPSGKSEGPAERFLLGSLLDRVDGLDVLSVDAPLGRALLGAVPGEVRSAVLPSGRTVSVRLVSIAPSA